MEFYTKRKGKWIPDVEGVVAFEGMPPLEEPGEGKGLDGIGFGAGFGAGTGVGTGVGGR